MTLLREEYWQCLPAEFADVLVHGGGAALDMESPSRRAALPARSARVGVRERKKTVLGAEKPCYRGQRRKADPTERETYIRSTRMSSSKNKGFESMEEYTPTRRRMEKRDCLGRSDQPDVRSRSGKWEAARKCRASARMSMMRKDNGMAGQREWRDVIYVGWQNVARRGQRAVESATRMMREANPLFVPACPFPAYKPDWLRGHSRDPCHLYK
ncbi:hypothetical protein DFH06DRAFT_1137355 [Mycena polygramma]|nr:hypothetical protein DFH06DRAFT_1137355 [Mycena polygramma]